MNYANILQVPNKLQIMKPRITTTELRRLDGRGQFLDCVDLF